MKYQLNPNVETFLLLLNPNWGREQKKEAIKQLDELGMNGIAFYAANFSVVEQYYAAFASQMVRIDESAIFEDMCDELVLLLLAILVLQPEWLNDFDTVSDEDARALVREGIIDFLEGEEEIFNALEASGFSDQTKWQMTVLLQQPKQKLRLVFDAVNTNLAAYEYAYAKLEPEITLLLTQLDKQLRKGNLSAVVHKTLAFNPKTQIIPSMAVSLGLMAFGEFTVYGLLTNRLFVGQDKGLTDTEAILVAKALSDPSKLEILLALKKDELYNLEIARAIGLTPATTSHHMNMLLSANLVEVSKKDGKVYYRLSAEGLKRYHDWLDDNLL